jgi:hypothetical protein
MATTTNEQRVAIVEALNTRKGEKYLARTLAAQYGLSEVRIHRIRQENRDRGMHTAPAPQYTPKQLAAQRAAATRKANKLAAQAAQELVANSTTD